MNLDDRLRMLNPAPAPLAERPLDERAEADLAALLADDDTVGSDSQHVEVRPDGKPRQPRRPSSLRSRPGRPRWVLPAAAAVIAVVIGLGGGVFAHHQAYEKAVLVATQSVARPLEIDAPGRGREAPTGSADIAPRSDAPETKADVISLARKAGQSAAQPRSPRDLEVTHWELGTMWDASEREITPDITLPKTYRLSAERGDIVRQVITAGMPLDADGRPLNPETRNLKGEDLKPGETVTHEYTDADFSGMFPEPPPATGDAMEMYLANLRDNNLAAVADGDRGLLQITGMMLMHWSLTPEANDALLQNLGADPGIDYLGQTTDRYGNPAYALGLKTEDDGTYRASLLVNANTGQITGYEEAYLAGPQTGEPDFPIPSVLRYIQLHDR
ncbi:hypothetical protein E7744_15550 (plasmid) [Citricoccus sp. SGAir0253]|uniref:hypothetical protein n=1 Tax=Citricoccus sp. SGAir0253 TaxID=2567881 RepID=UPI0010CD0F84|nr:hypothetical protein [Citricoccus sp. SGAir0253]QCU79724.1 hypothetical protein E7744_15550 [Citricoccus sp. SGAir0253]